MCIFVCFRFRIPNAFVSWFDQNAADQNSTVKTQYASAHHPSLAARPRTYLLQTDSYDISIHPRHLSVLPTVVFYPCCRQDIQTTAAVFYLTSGRLKTRDWKTRDHLTGGGGWKTRDWKTRDQFTRVENAGLEKAGPWYRWVENATPVAMERRWYQHCKTEMDVVVWCQNIQELVIFYML